MFLLRQVGPGSNQCGHDAIQQKVFYNYNSFVLDGGCPGCNSKPQRWLLFDGWRVAVSTQPGIAP